MKKLTEELALEIRSIDYREAVEATEKATDEQTGTFEVVITTENVDRYGEVIKLDGWDLDHYIKNPVVLWGHDHHTPPIGMATSIKVIDGKMVAKGKFAPGAFAQEIRALYDLGFMRATSVGFIVKEQEGNLITKSELIEFSFVSVPANPYALSLAIDHNMNVNELVTRGFMNIKEAEPAGDTLTVDYSKDAKVFFAHDDDEEGDQDPETCAQPVDKLAFSKSAVRIAKLSLKNALTALDALEDEEPEGSEEEEESIAESEEEKQFREFSQNRKTIQEAATIFGEVLAVARQAIEARK